MIVPLRIVVVEDDAVILMQLQDLLEDAGHLVVGTAMSASEAIAMIDQTGPELVLLDMQLNDGSSGLEVARAVRTQDGVTVVFITANSRKLDDDLEGAAGVIAKPFSDRTIASSIAYLEECLHRPPPHRDLPFGMRMAPAYLARMSG